MERGNLSRSLSMPNNAFKGRRANRARLMADARAQGGEVLRAIATGVSVCVILQVLAAAAAKYVFDCCFEAQTAPPLWYAMLSSPLGAIAGLLPGFIAGWLHPRQGIAAGFITGLVGNAIYSAIFLTMWSSVIEGGGLQVLEMILRLLSLASSWAFGSAAAGGTAQLLRSNRRFQRIAREDARPG